MTCVSTKVIFHNDIETVWKIVNDVENYYWRSDLSKVDKISDTQFIEYTKEGYPTTFTITQTKPYECWAFEIDNTNIKGDWKGEFTSVKEGCEVTFTENVVAKKIFMKPLVKMYLKKQQTLFINDLKKALYRNK